MWDLYQAPKKRAAMQEEYDKHAQAQQELKLSQLDKMEQGVFAAVHQMTGDREEAARLAQLARQNPDMAKNIMTQIAEQRYQEATTAAQNAEAMGLQPGSPEYNEYVREATIRKGTNVSITNEGKPREDFQFVRDDQGRVVSEQVIPGSKTDMELQEEAEKKKLARVNLVNKFDQNVGLVNATMDLVNPITASGAGQKIGEFVQEWGVPNKAGQLSSMLKTVKAKIGFDTLEQMRQVSPTGGALGQVSERELDFLQNALVPLDQNVGEDMLKDSLDTVRKAYQRQMFLMQNEADLSTKSAEEIEKILNERFGGYSEQQYQSFDMNPKVYEEMFNAQMNPQKPESNAIRGWNFEAQ
jgi:hypothetical protein